MTVTTPIETLFAALEADELLVTANNRLARVINQHYSSWRMQNGDSLWTSPRILSWHAWVGKLWESAALAGIEGTDRAVLGQRQCLSLWTSVLQSDPEAVMLMRPESLARSIRETRSTLIEWQVPLAHPAWKGEANENHAAFQRWNRAFEHQCDANGWVPQESRLERLLTSKRAAGQLNPGKVHLLGFDEFTPQQQAWLDLLRAGGCVTETLHLETAQTEPPQFMLWQSTSENEQLERMARWVRERHENQPNHRIAVVVADLQNRRSEIERWLTATLSPGGHSAKSGKPWNVSLGHSLLDWPMIRAAMDILHLVNHSPGNPRVELQAVGRLLRSPWIHDAREEHQARALLEKCLREYYQRQIKLSEVRYRARELNKYDAEGNELPPDQQTAKPWHAPGFARLVDSLMDFEVRNRSEQSPSAWADAFETLLDRTGWPRAGLGGDTSSQDWQAYQAWQDALRELASLNATLPAMSRSTAISQLRQICTEQVFQPATAPSNIQVLGLYEASGLRFDHLWVMGLHDGNWPPPAQPDPFIPGELQQMAGLPHSSPQRELEVARTVTERLLRTAPDVVFSYPGTLDGEKVLSSPLLNIPGCIASEDGPPAWDEPLWLQMIQSAGPGEEQALDALQPLKGRASGGSSILKHQSLCPFRAFASNRLGAESLASPADGISPALHGSLMHQVLEHFWRETGDQATLLSLSPGQLRERVSRHVDHVVNEDRSLQNRPDFRDVEARRLQRLALSYLQQEAERDAFEVIGFEREILHEIEGQTIRLIIDRIDRLPSGDEIIIDYKTGKVTPAKWFGVRPQDPQLPLYAISSKAIPAGIAFAVLRDDECVYKGVVQGGGILPGLPPRPRRGSVNLAEAGEQMEETIKNWREVLHGLMRDFLAGEAAIDPVEGTKTCQASYCELQPLCRIGELTRS